MQILKEVQGSFAGCEGDSAEFCRLGVGAGVFCGKFSAHSSSYPIFTTIGLSVMCANICCVYLNIDTCSVPWS